MAAPARPQRVALVTCRDLPDLTADDRALLPALAQTHVAVSVLSWDDPRARWSDYDAVVLRSTWDYHRRIGAFRQWLDRLDDAGVRLWNPTATVRWNAEKTYLIELRKRGFLTMETVWIEPGSPARLAEVLENRAWPAAVLKPTVGASAFRTYRTTLATARADQPRLDEILADSGAMVQEFAEAVAEAGEWSFVFFGGRFSHAVLKRARAGEFRVQSEWGGSFETAVPRAALRDEAEAIVRAIPADMLFARVDGIERDGRFLLMELELIEPELFLTRHEAAARSFAEAIFARL